jgi:hypothetical protein
LVTAFSAVTGVAEADVLTHLENGGTLAELAEMRGLSVDLVTAEISARLDESPALDELPAMPSVFTSYVQNYGLPTLILGAMAGVFIARNERRRRSVIRSHPSITEESHHA